MIFSLPDTDLIWLTALCAWLPIGLLVTALFIKADRDRCGNFRHFDRMGVLLYIALFTITWPCLMVTWPRKKGVADYWTNKPTSRFVRQAFEQDNES